MTTSNRPNDGVIYINMCKNGDYYVCNIDLKRLEEIRIREHIRKLLNS